MEVIWKYPLRRAAPEIQEFDAPTKKAIISVGLDGEESLAVWMHVDITGDPDTQTYDRVRIMTVWTGRPFLESPKKYIGTVRVGHLIYHIYDQS